jgi:hypothetical protein
LREIKWTFTIGDARGYTQICGLAFVVSHMLSHPWSLSRLWARHQQIPWLHHDHSYYIIFTTQTENMTRNSRLQRSRCSAPTIILSSGSRFKDSRIYTSRLDVSRRHQFPLYPKDIIAYYTIAAPFKSIHVSPSIHSSSRLHSSSSNQVIARKSAFRV